jgi:transcriptional regulator with XRE-family HTH domain
MGVLIAFNESGLTQEELADRLSWDPSKVSRTLRGKRRIYVDELQEIAGVLGGDIGWYLNGYGTDAKGDYLSSLAYAV